MVETMKNRNKGGLTIFPSQPDFFDQMVSERMKWLILSTAKELERPILKTLASALGVLPGRLTRLMEGLGIEQEYKQIRLDKGIGKKVSRSRMYKEFMEKTG
jgi:hypothetical protein